MAKLFQSDLEIEATVLCRMNCGSESPPWLLHACYQGVVRNLGFQRAKGLLKVCHKFGHQFSVDIVADYTYTVWTAVSLAYTALACRVAVLRVDPVGMCIHSRFLSSYIIGPVNVSCPQIHLITHFWSCPFTALCVTVPRSVATAFRLKSLTVWTVSQFRCVDVTPVTRSQRVNVCKSALC